MPAQTGSNIIRGGAVLLPEGDWRNATRVEWTKLTRNFQDLFLALRTAAGSAFARSQRPIAKPRRIQLVATRSIGTVDLRLLADMERRKSLAILNNTRNQVR